MNAEEARQITEANLQGPVIAPLLEAAHERIRDFAERGHRSVAHPFCEAKECPTTEARVAALDALRREGYTVKHHPNPDPGDPRSSEYDEVSW